MVSNVMGAEGGMGTTQEAESKPIGLGARGSSMYGLTLDQVQNQLGDFGKPVNSMNLDEFVKTVCTIKNHDTTMQQQMPRDLGTKTLDEVWQDIQSGNTNGTTTHERQPTLGEITLEDFLVKAGIIAESMHGKRIPGLVSGVDSMSLTQQAQWTDYQIPTQNCVPAFMPSHQVQQPLPVFANPIMEATYPETQMVMSPGHLMATLSDTQAFGRKRFAPDDDAENSVERRQKRMIKNRESAARSRARKQAYTHELENKLSWLEEENERLKKHKEMEKIIASIQTPEPKYQLRRTSSAPI